MKRAIIRVLFLVAVLCASVAYAAKVWYAACESGHPYWESSTAASYQQAQSYATAHDKAAHDGSPTAAVFSKDE